MQELFSRKPSLPLLSLSRTQHSLTRGRQLHSTLEPIAKTTLFQEQRSTRMETICARCILMHAITLDKAIYTSISQSCTTACQFSRSELPNPPSKPNWYPKLSKQPSSIALPRSFLPPGGLVRSCLLGGCGQQCKGEEFPFLELNNGEPVVCNPRLGSVYLWPKPNHVE